MSVGVLKPFAHLAITVLLLSLGSSAAVTPSRVLRRASEVRSLPAEDAKREIPVSLQGVITFVDPGWGMLFVQDQSAGIYVFLKDSHAEGLLEPGMKVRVDGVSTAGEFSPCVTKARIVPVGRGSFPEPKRVPFERLITGSQDGQWSEIEGIVRSGRIRREHLVLSVLIGGGRSTVTVAKFPADWQNRFVDATVRVRGVMATRFNTHRQIIGLSLFTPSLQFLQILEPAPAEPFAAPEVATAKLGQFFVNSRWVHRVRLRGVVTGLDLDGSLFVSDGKDNLYVRTPEPCGATPGSRIDVVGFAGTENRPTIDEAICRTLGPAPPVAAARVGPSDLFGHDVGVESPYDMAPIQIEGQLIEFMDGPRGSALVVKAGNELFNANLPKQAGKLPASLQAGSLIRLTGVCITIFNNFQQATAFRLLLRSPDDIRIVQTPSWWTIGRAMWGLALTIAACFGSLAWISILRRRVAGRTRDLEEANESLRVANETLLQLAKEDALTGAANRRKFDETVEAEFNRARRTSAPLSLLMIDIDHFKDVNDCLGHQKGDEYLRLVVGIVQKMVQRGTDLVARYGGEEFAVVLPAAEHRHACTLAERIRLAVLSAEIPHPLNDFGGVLTVSIGVSTVESASKFSSSPDELVATADHALYRAKLEGRNRCVAQCMDAAWPPEPLDVPGALAAANAFSQSPAP